ncbi:MAG: VOC family protein [Pseudomonadales bacterium]|nr:VOC family protein [Pseudomonadales bacterium]
MITGMPRIAIAVKDFKGLVSFFRDKLDMPVIDMSRKSVVDYGAALGMCVPDGGSNIELMSPVDPDSPLSKSLQGFLDRRGEGLFALMLEAPVPDDEADELAGRALNIMPLMSGAYGRDVHPSATHGVLIRVYPVNSFQGEFKGQVNDSVPRLSGIARVIIAVEDIVHAIGVYGSQFKMPVGDIVDDTERGIYSVICQPPTGGAIELVAVNNAARPFAQAIKQHLLEDREGMYAIVLTSPDLEGTAASLSSNGVSVDFSKDNVNVLEVSPEHAFGVLIRIEQN